MSEVQAKGAARLLALAEHNATLYPPTHPSVLEVVRELHQVLSALLEGRASVTLKIFRDTLLVEDEILADETVHYRRLVRRFDAMGIGGIVFAHGLQEKELAAALEVILHSGDKCQVAELRAKLTAAGVRNVHIAEATDPVELEEAEAPPDSSTAKELHIQAVSVLREVETTVRQGGVLDVAPAETVVGSLVSEVMTNRGMLVAVANIKSHDEYTLYHSVNVCILSLALGTALSLDHESLSRLGLSGLLHDLGKIYIPESILRKGDNLTQVEWDVIKRHPSAGAQLLKKLRAGQLEPMIVAYEHHMRFDLQGYPAAPPDRNLHLFSRIVAICDAYDALTTERSYRTAILPDQAMGVLMRNTGAYDPALTKVLIHALGIYPIGAAVRLNTGETGIVVDQRDRELLLPMVLVVVDRSGRFLERDSRFVVDTGLADDDGNRRISVVEVVDARDLPVQYADLF